MSIRGARVPALALLLAAAVAHAQAPPRANTLVHATAARVSVRAGAKATAHVRLEVLRGWHIYSNPPALDYNIPTVVALAPGFGVHADAPGYPRGRLEKVAGDDQPMAVYDSTTNVALPLSASAGAVNGTHVLRGTVRYQACNDQMCL
ncbi:MAG TPA: protein-disulfide reductase DsbD domain-containing protein, partial [Candidatus Acidoferrales bacterium]|nr:protein-disulfide reductase DsbD domain-containing protein [Candidatus Acidoferrales bacterium]